MNCPSKAAGNVPAKCMNMSKKPYCLCAAGGMNSQAGSRSGWSLHSITFSAADAAAAKESRQLTLSQMTWSMEHSKGK